MRLRVARFVVEWVPIVKRLGIQIVRAPKKGGRHAARLFRDEGSGAGWANVDGGTFASRRRTAALDPGRLQADFKNAADGAALAGVGDGLFELLSGALTALPEQIAALKGEREPFSAVLDVDPPELRALPWELLRFDGAWLFLTHQIVRSPLDPRRGASHEWPVRVLVVVGNTSKESPDPAFPAIAWEDEVDAVRCAVAGLTHVFDLQVLCNPSKKALFAAMRGEEDEQDRLDSARRRPPHVFHFIGHGIGGAHPALQLWDGTNRWNCTMELLRSQLAGPAPRIALLNSCHTSTAGGVEWAVADAFLRIGTGTVVGMQHVVGGRAAAALTQALYQGLVRGEPADEVMRKARRDMQLVDANTNFRDWAVPRLEMTCTLDTVLCPGVSAEAGKRLREQDPFKRHPLVLDREVQRRRIVYDARPQAADGARLLILSGERQVGTSALLCWALGCAKLAGWHPVLVDCEERQNSVAQILDAIRKAIVAVRPSAAGAFAGYQDRGASVLADLGGSASMESVEAAMALFRQGVKDAVPEGSQLVLGLDNLTNKTTIAYCDKLLIKQLFTPVASGDVPGVRIWVAVAEDVAREVPLERAAAIAVPPFGKEQWNDVIHELVRVHGRKVCDYQEMINAAAKFIQGPWKPERIKPFIQLTNIP